MADDDAGFPFGFGDDTSDADNGNGDTNADASSILRLGGVVAVVDEQYRCPYGFCRQLCDGANELRAHQSRKGHYVCMECAKPRTSRSIRTPTASVTTAATATDDKLVATRAFQSARLLELHMGSMHGIGNTTGRTLTSTGGGWSLNDLCDDLLLRTLSFLDLEPLATIESVCSHWRTIAASPSGQELWQSLASWMMVVMDASLSRSSSTSTSAGTKKILFARADKKKSIGDDNDDNDDTKLTPANKGGKAGKGKNKGRDNDGSSGAAQRSGAVSTTDAKRPPKWKHIVAQKYLTFARTVWIPAYSPLAAHISVARDEDQWTTALTRHCLFDLSSLTRRYLVQFTPLHWLVYLNGSSAGLKTLLQAVPVPRRVTGIVVAPGLHCSGMNVLQMAVWYNRIELVQTLLEFGQCELKSDCVPSSDRPFPLPLLSLCVARSLDADMLPMMRLLVGAGAPVAPHTYFDMTYEGYYHLNPLELAFIFRGRANGERLPIVLPSGRGAVPLWQWDDHDEFTHKPVLATGQRFPTKSIDSNLPADEQRALRGTRAWNMDIIHYLVEAGGNDHRWCREASGSTSPVKWHLTPLYLSLFGSNDLRPELIRFVLSRMVPLLHIPAVPLIYRSSICDLVAHLDAHRSCHGSYQTPADAHYIANIRNIMSQLIDSGIGDMNEPLSTDIHQQPLVIVIRGMSINYRGSPLCGAAYREWLSLIRYMLDNGARIDSLAARMSVIQSISDLKLAQMIFGHGNTGISLTHWRCVDGDRLARASERYQQLYNRRTMVHTKTCVSRLQALLASAQPYPEGMAKPKDLQESPLALTLDELTHGYRHLCTRIEKEQHDDDIDGIEQWTLRITRWNNYIATNNGTNEEVKGTKMIGASNSENKEGKSESKPGNSSSSNTNGTTAPIVIRHPRATTWLHSAASHASPDLWRWLLYDVGVDPNIRSPSLDDEDHPNYTGGSTRSDYSPLLCLLLSWYGFGRGYEPQDMAHMPMWTHTELKEHEMARAAADAVLARPAAMITPAERKAANQVIKDTPEDRIPSDDCGVLMKLDMLIRHPKFNANNCNADGVTDIQRIEDKLRDTWGDQADLRVARSPLLGMLKALRDGKELPPSFMDHPRHRFNPLSSWRDYTTGDWVHRTETSEPS